MTYSKTYRQIQREKRQIKLREDLLFILGILAFLVLLGLVGKVAG